MFFMKKIKIAILANVNSIHTIRWVNALAARGHDVNLISQDFGEEAKLEKIKVHYLPFQGRKGYFINAPFLRKYLKRIKPDLLHAHYASGYGTLGRLSGFRPYILSVWGSDVYDFPSESPLKREILKGNLRSADLIASTSNVMAKQTLKICPDLSKIFITPFGIDTDLFKPAKSQKNHNIFTIGTIKSLAFKYGIDTLIKAFAEARHSLATIDQRIASQLRLLVVGEGEEKERLSELVVSLGLSDVAEFTGAVPHTLVPDYLNRLDIYIAASRLDSESFGVAILEASACALPVIVANVGGLPEVVEDGVTGIIVEKDDYFALANAIVKLVMDEDLRKKLGQAGSQRVISQYKWEDSVSTMEDVYNRIV
jgi:L-malate glycosyltransferase